MKFNYTLGTTVSAWVLAALVVIAQLSPAFKSLLAAVFTHHWIAKAVLITVVFVVAGCIDRNVSEKKAWYSIVGSLVAIGLFFVVEYVFL